MKVIEYTDRGGVTWIDYEADSDLLTELWIELARESEEGEWWNRSPEIRIGEKVHGGYTATVILRRP